MKQSIKGLPAAVPVMLLILVFALFPVTVRAEYSGSHESAEAYDALAVGETVVFDDLNGKQGYGDDFQIVRVVREDGSTLQTWNERVLGTDSGIPYFCIEQNEAYVSGRTATVYNGLEYMSQEEITKIALALKYLEDHIEEVDENKTDLYYLQQIAVWQIRDAFGYDAYDETVSYALLRLKSQPSEEESAEFSMEIVARAMEWAEAGMDRYTGYCKVLDSGKFQRCAVFKVMENPTSFDLPETGSAGTIALSAAGGLFILVSVLAGAKWKGKEKK